jgi:hypothetical protein
MADHDGRFAVGVDRAGSPRRLAAACGDGYVIEILLLEA